MSRSLRKSTQDLRKLYRNRSEDSVRRRIHIDRRPTPRKLSTAMASQGDAAAQPLAGAANPPLPGNGDAGVQPAQPDAAPVADPGQPLDPALLPQPTTPTNLPQLSPQAGLRHSKSRSRSTSAARSEIHDAQIKELQDAIKELKQAKNKRDQSAAPAKSASSRDRHRPATRRSHSRSSRRRRTPSPRSRRSRSTRSRTYSRSRSRHRTSRSTRSRSPYTRRENTRSRSRHSRAHTRSPTRRSHRRHRSRSRSSASGSGRSASPHPRPHGSGKDYSPRAMRRQRADHPDDARAIADQYPHMGKPKGRRIPKSRLTLEPYRNLPHDLRKIAGARKSRRDLTMPEHMCGLLFTIAKGLDPDSEAHAAVTHAAQVAQDAATLTWPAVRGWSQACLAHIQEGDCTWKAPEMFLNERTRLSWINGKGKQQIKLPCIAYNTDRCAEANYHVTEGYTWVHACSCCHNGLPDANNSHAIKHCRRKHGLKLISEDGRPDNRRRYQNNNNQNKRDKPDNHPPAPKN